MVSKDEARTLIDTAIKYAMRRKVDGIEVSVQSFNVATSRFANNSMTQNQAPLTVSISVRVHKDGKQARLTSDHVTVGGIRELVDNAITAAEFLDVDKEMLPLSRPEKRTVQKDVVRYDARTATFSAEKRAQAIKSIVDIALKNGLTAAGIFASGSWAQAIGNSEGLFRYHRETNAECSITMKHVDSKTGVESTGWAKQHSPRVGDIDAVALATRAADKALMSANPEEVPPGKYTVVLEPSAVLDLLCYLNYDVTATSFVDKLSCFFDKRGKSVAGKNITIADDVFHPLQSGCPFDGEGMQRRRVDLIKSGTLSGLVAGRRSARKLGIDATGHGLPEPSVAGEWPRNIVVQGGEKDLEELIKSTSRGILLTRVWYVREVDPTSKIVTGMTRDGTFLIENGRIKCGIKNMRFNQSLLELLNNVNEFGRSLRTAGEEGEPAVVPAMKVENFNFSSITRF
jgi:predicted Zn-dependent protease